MNRNSVGKILRFLEHEERDEINKTNRLDLEWYNAGTYRWEPLRPENSKFPLNDNIAFRPKGLLSWVEIDWDFRAKYMGKKISLKNKMKPFYMSHLDFFSYDDGYEGISIYGRNFPDASKSRETHRGEIDLSNPSDWGYRIVS